jgi:hypothetical protein
LRASSFQSLNDSSELAYGVALVRKVFGDADLAGNAHGLNLLSDFVDRFDEHLLDRDYYIVCASKDGDSLNQWRNYASGNGYALGLKTGVYAQIVDREYDFPQKTQRALISRPVWMDVIYAKAAQEAAALRLLQTLVAPGDSLLDDAIDDGADPVNDLLLHLGTFVATLKHPAFAVEKEVRLIVDRSRHARPEFHAGRFGIVPFIEVGKPHPNAEMTNLFPTHIERSELAPLPVSAIMCGPGEEFGRERRRRVAAALMARHNFDVTVEASLIPLVT